mgnify:CR=1 FL=1
MVLLPRNFAGLLLRLGRTFSNVCLVRIDRNTLTTSYRFGAEMRTQAHYVVGGGLLHQSPSSSPQATSQSHASILTGIIFTGTVKQLRSGRVKSPCSRRR